MTVDYLFEREGTTHLALEFRSASKILNEHSAKLIFEYRPGQEAQSNSLIPAREPHHLHFGHLKTRLRPVPEQLPPHSYEYLVVYVRMLDRLVKRVEGRGFKLRTPVRDHFGVRFGVATDPNGVNVRLIQLNDAQMNEPAAIKNQEPNYSQWFGRIGYYTLPTAQGESTVRYYERLFSSTIDMSLFGGATGKAGGEGKNGHPKGNGDQSAAAKPSSAGQWDVDMDVLRPAAAGGVGGKAKKQVPDLEVATKQIALFYKDTIEFSEENVMMPTKSIDVVLSTLAETTTGGSVESVADDTGATPKQAGRTQKKSQIHAKSDTNATSDPDLAPPKSKPATPQTLTTPSGRSYPLTTPAPRAFRLLRLKTPSSIQFSQTPPTAPPKRSKRVGRVGRPRVRAVTREGWVSRAAEPGGTAMDKISREDAKELKRAASVEW
ncbi:hypothetical protein HDV00_006814 [Rhizophlyctis rosea]|nr:hypothetical protein HDV00_006814 [Rhizophlyctis rosea]